MIYKKECITLQRMVKSCQSIYHSIEECVRKMSKSFSVICTGIVL